MNFQAFVEKYFEESVKRYGEDATETCRPSLMVIAAFRFEDYRRMSQLEEMKKKYESKPAGLSPVAVRTWSANAANVDRMIKSCELELVKTSSAASLLIELAVQQKKDRDASSSLEFNKRREEFINNNGRDPTDVEMIHIMELDTEKPAAAPEMEDGKIY